MHALCPPALHPPRLFGRENKNGAHHHDPAASVGQGRRIPASGRCTSTMINETDLNEMQISTIPQRGGGEMSTRINETDLNEGQISTIPQRGKIKSQRGSTKQISTRCKSQRSLNAVNGKCQRASTGHGPSTRNLNDVEGINGHSTGSGLNEP